MKQILLIVDPQNDFVDDENDSETCLNIYQ